MCLPDPEIVVFITAPLVASTSLTLATEEAGLFLFVLAFCPLSFLSAGCTVASSSANAAAVSLMYAPITLDPCRASSSVHLLVACQQLK